MAVRLSEVIGSGYDEFWEDKHFYECLKGGRGSKKSKTMALRTIYRMMAYPGANTLVVRRVYSTLKDSCFTELLWAINALGVSAYWKAKTSPLELIYYPDPTHREIFQKILFRGMDDPQKITSIAVEQGYLCWVWIEEAYQITDESDFDKLMMSIRGKVPKSSGLFKQVTMTFNPWRENWIKTRFFDNKDDTVYT
jgi:phage terminase large subunit